MTARDDYEALTIGLLGGNRLYPDERQQLNAALNELDHLRADVSNLLTKMAAAVVDWRNER